MKSKYKVLMLTLFMTGAQSHAMKPKWGTVGATAAWRRGATVRRYYIAELRRIAAEMTERASVTQSNNKRVVAGLSRNGRMLVIRYEADGSPDPTFYEQSSVLSRTVNNALRLIGVGGRFIPDDIDIDIDKDIYGNFGVIVQGYSTTDPQKRISFRLFNNGELDRGFGVNGLLIEE